MNFKHNHGEIAKLFHFFFLLQFCCDIQEQCMNQEFCKKKKLSHFVDACFERNTEMTS